MKLILCYPPHVAPDELHGQGREWYPVGIASLAAYISTKHDIDIVCLDLFDLSYDTALNTIINEMTENDINLVGFTLMTEQRATVFNLCADLKQRVDDYNAIANTTTQVKTIVGGPHASIMYQQIWDNYSQIDFIVVGEGEKGLDWVVNNPDKKGIVKEGQVENLDELPLAIEGLKFFKPELKFKEYPIVSSRGCTDRCTFCTTYKTWHGYRIRSAHNIFLEINKAKALGYNYFKFHDDSATADIQNFTALCYMLCDSRINFEITIRADQLNSDLVKALKMAGCVKVALGLESGSEKLRKSMGKKLDMALAYQNVRLLKTYGIHVHGLFIVGWPGETEETIEETRDMIKDLALDSFSNLPGLMVLPGTPIYNKFVHDGWIDDNFWLTSKAPPYYTGEHNFDTLNYFGLRLRAKDARVLIAAVVNQEERVFEEYLFNLTNMYIPKDVEVSKCFILHNSPDLKKYLKPDEYIEVNNNLVHDMSHTWTIDKFAFLADMKNKIVEIAKSAHATHILWVDSDLLVHPNTLKHLLNINTDIVGEMFLTQWSGADKPMPNAWHVDQYSFYADPKLFDTPGLFQVGGTGALILVNTNVYSEYVNYNVIPNISFSIWEDRAFCIRAAVMGYNIYFDTKYPAKHLYTKDIADKYFNGIIKGGGASDGK